MRSRGNDLATVPISAFCVVFPQITRLKIRNFILIFNEVFEFFFNHIANGQLPHNGRSYSRAVGYSRGMPPSKGWAAMSGK
jgi:hypothetical protein